MNDLDPKVLADMAALNERLGAVLKKEQLKEGDAYGHRIARLEERLDKVWDDHAETKRLAGILEERIKHLPTKPDLWKALGALFVGVTAIITFAEKLQSLVR